MRIPENTSMFVSAANSAGGHVLANLAHGAFQFALPASGDEHVGANAAIIVDDSWIQSAKPAVVLPHRIECS